MTAEERDKIKEETGIPGTRHDGRKMLPYATPPGDTLRETLQAKGISQTLLAETMGRPIKTINEIIHAKARITEHTAIELEHALNIPAHVWMALETNYRIALARGQNDQGMP